MTPWPKVGIISKYTKFSSMFDKVQYLTAESLAAFKKEYDELKSVKLLEIAKRIDEARQQGDLSENAEYHQAREDMSWAQGRLAELEYIISNAQIFKSAGEKAAVEIGNTVLVRINGKQKEYTIVGPQEVDPAKGKISNESPLGEAFLGHKIKDKVEVATPAGKQVYEIIEIK